MNFSNKNIWILTDGSQGMISQARGLAQQFSSNILEIKTDLVFPWSKLQPGYLPVYKWIFKLLGKRIHRCKRQYSVAGWE